MDINNLQEELKKVSKIIEENEKLKRELKYSIECKNKLNEQIKSLRENYTNRERALREQIYFMRSVLNGIFKECQTCKGEGGFCIDLGEAGFYSEECADCLGTGIKLCNAQSKNSPKANASSSANA